MTNFSLPYLAISGRVVADPVRRTVRNGSVVTNFRVAFSAKTRQADGSIHEGPSEYFNVAAWNNPDKTKPQLADDAATLRRGQAIGVVGRMKTSVYNRKDGTPAVGVSLTATKISRIVDDESGHLYDSPEAFMRDVRRMTQP